MSTVLVEIINPILKNSKVITGMCEMDISTAINFEKAGDVKILEGVLEDKDLIEIPIYTFHER